jgi:phosphate transport system protein
MAGDLRTIVSALRIASDLERIADHAANIAKRGIALSQMPPIRPMSAVPRLGRMVQHMVKEVLDAYMARDAKRAMRVWEQDEELDEGYTSMFREALTYMMEDPRNISFCIHLMFCAKNIERIGDHATNIAETVFYMIEGQQMVDKRPKGDMTTFAATVPD